MEALFWQEAERNQVLPLNATTFTRLVQPRPSLAAGRTVFTYSGEITGTPNGDAPSVIATLLQLQGRYRGPQGWCRRHDRDPGWPLCRLRLLFAERQAGIHLEPGRSQAHQMGRSGGARTRQALRSNSTSSTTVWVPRRSRSAAPVAWVAAAPVYSR